MARLKMIDRVKLRCGHWRFGKIGRHVNCIAPTLMSNGGVDNVGKVVSAWQGANNGHEVSILNKKGGEWQYDNGNRIIVQVRKLLTLHGI